ncbi:MAG: hypothetical protein P1V81_01000 [Planctomycetota bacterium]|nr:hypothetical protein [Planctomycetota bacterium]
MCSLRTAFLAATLLTSLSTTALASDLADHPVLGKLTFDELEPTRGTIIQVQLSASGDTERLDTIGAELAEIFTELELRFDEVLGGPAGLGSSDDREPIEAVVLLDNDTWNKVRPSTPTPPGAHFDPELGAIVTYDLAWPGSPRSKRIRGLRRALVAALFDAHGASPPAWLALGAEQHLLADLGDEDAAPEARTERLLAELLEGGFEHGFLLPVLELMNLGGRAALFEFASAHTTEVRDTERWTERRVETLGELGGALFDFLVTSETYREPLLEHLGASVRGEAPGPMVTDLEATDLEAAFWDDLLGAERKRRKDFDPRGLVAPELFTEAVGRLGLDSGSADAGEEVDPKANLEMALWQAGQGNLKSARALLEAAAGDPDCDRHLVGIAALEDLRMAYLEHLCSALGDAGKLRVEHEGRTVSADVTRVGLRSVFLADNSRGLERVAIDDLPIGDLVERMEKEKPAFGDPAARAWAIALVGGKWKRSLTNEQKRDKALNADLDAIAGLLDRGRILSGIATVCDTQTSTDEVRLATAAELLASDADHELLQAELWRMTAACKTLLEETFDAGDPLDLLAVTPKRDGDRLSLTYDFDEEQQLLDWPLVAEYSPEFVTLLPALEDSAPLRELERKKGVGLEGSQAFQHLLSFGGPMTLTYEFSFERTKKKRDAGNYEVDFLFASICDDLGYNHLRTGQFGELDVVDVESKGNVHLAHPEPLDYKLGQTYRIELELLGNDEVETRLDGKRIFNTSAHGRSQGRVAFLLHSDRRVHLQSVTIEGVLLEDQSSTRRLYVESRMAALGF